MFRRILLVLSGMLACVLGLELALRALPTSTYTDTGYHIDPMIITYRPYHSFWSSEGWNFANAIHQHTNNLGFLSPRDFVPDPDALAVIGDSYVDASMLPVRYRVGEQIQARLPGRPVYAMGGPGSSLLDYAERIRYASEKLRISDFVIMVEEGDVRQSYCGSGNNHGPCLDRNTGRFTTQRQAPPSRAKLVLRHSELLQYLLGHLRLDLVALVKRGFRRVSADNAPVPQGGRTHDVPRPDAQRILDRFFETVHRDVRGRLVMVFDADRHAINGGEASHDATRDLAMARARAEGATVVDMDAPFREFVTRTGRHLEVSPADHHWNRAATALVADAAVRALRVAREISGQ
ncbi:MAG: hypothetical protein GC151_09625 [Betaproteobacteria bacterium]|nr:hypothetical protein [Betaproteobacteria bacterium]